MTTIQAKGHVDMIEAIIQTYHDVTGAGGSLHIVIEDLNWDRESVAFCRDYAVREGDPIGAQLAAWLLDAPDAAFEAMRTDEEETDNGYMINLPRGSVFFSAWRDALER